MSEQALYTLCVENAEGDAEAVAVDVERMEAVKIITEHGGRTSQVTECEYDNFRLYEFRLFGKPDDIQNLTVLTATVTKTEDKAVDRALAEDILAVQFLERSRRYWNGSVYSAQDYAKLMERQAERQAVRRVEREIATKLIGALISAGYVISCDISDDVLEFDHSTDREGILAYLFQLEMAELHVFKEGSRAWLRLIFGEDGWDVVQDYSASLEPLIDPIVESYLPWNQPDADERDRGYSVCVLPSPEALARGEPDAEAAFVGFLRMMEKL